MNTFSVLEFHQYNSGTDDDKLLLFAAPAKAVAVWAGIPRKGWHIRLLYQRWITQGREKEIKEFWNTASKRNPTPHAGQKAYILGPTALTIAVHGSPDIQDGKIALEYTPPYDLSKPPTETLQTLAGIVLDRVKQRLEDSQKSIFNHFAADPLKDLPDTEHDYVLESLMQFAQMQKDPAWFIGKYGLEANDVDDIIEALESLCRPALVVDGQHRLHGASECDGEVLLPVVAIPNCTWTEQIYQFVVVNEKAKRVETSLLTDIFGSSLTRPEQRYLRDKLALVKCEIEPRIAATIATRNPTSPFYNMVNVKLEGAAPGNATPYIPESAIRYLIEGGGDTLGWRTDDDFYEYYVKPTFPDRAEWDSWTTGKWVEYWFEFWKAVRDFYNEQAKLSKKNETYLLWNSNNITNLTKSITLRLLQKLFIKQATARVEDVLKALPTLEQILGKAKAQESLKQATVEKAIPADINEFKESVKDWFLQKGIPVRFFMYAWKSSLDDAQGRQDLWAEMEKAYSLTQEGKRYRASSTSVFVAGNQDE